MSLACARNLAVLSFAPLLAVSLTAGSAQGRESSSARQVFAGTVAASGMAVATGTVAGATGAAMPGAAVDLYAWPSDAVLRALAPGDLVPTTLLATTTTNKAGRYSLRVPAAQLKAAAVSSGYANLEVFSPVGGLWFMPYQTGSLPARPSTPVTVDLGGSEALPCGTDSDGQPYTFTGFSLQRQRGPAWAVVGQGYIARTRRTAGDNMSFEYNQGASQSQSSALGVGISGYGIDAGYNSAGTHSSTATASEDYPSEASNAWFRTEFSTGQFRGECYGPLNDSKVPHERQHGQCPRKYTVDGYMYYVHKCLWLIHSTGWFGGATIAHPGLVPATRYCAFQEAGTHFNTSNGTAIQWSGGWELGAALGIKGANLKASFNSTAQTGYDKNALMQFSFRHSGSICGTNKVPAHAAILVMRG
jgi:hypothetical protein